MATRKPLLKVGAGSRTPVTRTALDPAPPGRPVSNIGRYLIKPSSEVDTGYELINADPSVLREVHQKYLKAGQLPPALQPKYIRKPEVLEQGVTGRAKNISRGWRKPRSWQG